MPFRFSRTALLVIAAATSQGCNLDQWLWGCRDLRALVEKVKGLDRAYFVQLHAYAASGECKSRCSPPLLDRLSGLGNRKPVFEVIGHNAARIKLSVCMDEGVILGFGDIGTPQATIDVSWSADDIHWDDALLWSANAADGGT
jgi:hypothetical protein